jgi:uncharacterized protein (TIGR02600 family)
MNTPHRASGMALLLVLGALVLLSVMILAFLSTVNTERIASGSQLKQTEARNLADSVIGLVTAQIREATTQPNTLWITQPGAIRTFTNTSVPGPVYKLYSAAEMIVPASSFTPATLSDVPTGGTLNGNMYTDLNAPVRAGGVWLYPILNPAATNIVEGFSVASSASTVSSNTISGAPAQIPMPVRWLYFLRNGDLQPMDSSGVVANATSNNPIVGRVAFWTDDETCKLNINTASSGMYWDQPIGVGSQFEKGGFSGAAGTLPVVTRTGLASSPPGVREFQRYPGHPAMTSLDVVFNNTNFFASSVTTADRVKKILELSPRVAWGGSQLGTNFPVTRATNPPGIVTLDKDRLYATVDELFYTTNRIANSTAGTNAVATPAMNLSSTNLSLVRFFLTANSRSPEVTAFNTPRVTIWPVDSTPTNRTVFDRTIAFCSTIGGREYIFQRSAFNPSSIGMVANKPFTGASSNGSQSATLDFTASNSTIYNYLKGLMAKPYPGFGASLASKFGTDSDQILTEIYDYIRCVNLFDCSATNATQYTGRPFVLREAHTMLAPLGLFADQYGASLRPGLPLPNDSLMLSMAGLGQQWFIPSAYMGQVVPAVIGSTRGFGRFPTIVGATLGFFATDPVTPKSPAYYATNPIQLLGAPSPGAPTPWTNNSYRDANTLTNWRAANTEPAGKIRGILIFSVVTPAAGPLSMTHTYDIRVNSGLSSFQVNGASANMTDGSINRIMGQPYRNVDASGLPAWEPLFSGGPSSIVSSSRSYTAGEKQQITPTGDNQSSYPFFSQSDISVNTSTLSFTGGTLDIDILVDNQVVQNVKMNFPDFTAPMPLWAPVWLERWGVKYFIDGKIISTTGSGTATIVTAQGGSWGNQRATGNATSTNWTTTIPSGALANWIVRTGLGSGGESGPMRFQLINQIPTDMIRSIPTCLMPNNLDTVRGIEMKTSAAPFGDARLVAGLQNVPASYFQPCAGYTDATRNQAHSLRNHPAATNGNLVAGVSTFSTNAATQLYGLPSTMTAATRSDGGPGDWDSGVARRDNVAGGRGFMEAGAFINKSSDAAYSFRDGFNIVIPYFNTQTMIVSTDNSFTPNRMMPSAGMFGSLPVGVKRGLPWQTLLFRPNFNASPAHPGSANPPDHLMLDLFQMPVVEPYAISEPFSSAGKVNLNWQIAPFSYIKRSTALRGVLYPEKITAVPTSNAYLFALNPTGQSGWGSWDSAQVFNYRYNIDRDATMTLFEDRFSTNGVFLTASQICEMPLVPKPEDVSASGLVPASRSPFQTALATNATAATITTYVNNFWANTTLGGAGTADNLRERPYTVIYPRVTVKSNTFQIHMKVQAIQKSPRTAANKMEQGDAIVATYQGSSIVERYLDTTQATFDPTDPNAQLGPYRFRVVNSKQFNP